MRTLPWSQTSGAPPGRESIFYVCSCIRRARTDFVPLSGALGPDYGVYGLQSSWFERRDVLPTPDGRSRGTLSPPNRERVIEFSEERSSCRILFRGWVAFELAPRYNVPGHRRARVSRVQARGGVEGAGGSLRGLCETSAGLRRLAARGARSASADRGGSCPGRRNRCMPQRSSPKALLARLRALEAALRTTYRPE